MNRLKFCASALVASLGWLTSAFAADISVKAPAYVPPTIFNWTGGYIGGTVGYGGGDANHSCCTTTVRSRDFDINGFVGGGTLGYNWQFGNRFVLGVETDISYADIRGSIASQPAIFTCGQGPALRCDTKVSWFGTLRGRLGPTFDRIFIYGTAGLAYGGVFGSIPDAAAFGLGGSTTTRSGWTAGGGIEWSVNPNWSVKAEALRVDLGSTVYGTFTLTGDHYSTRAAFNVARLGVNYRFGDAIVARY